MRRLLAILLVAPLSLGGVAYAMRAATTVKAAPFALTVTPSVQTVVLGASASFNAGVLRAGGFTGQVSLRVVGLAPGVRAGWVVAAGRPGGVLGANERAATLTLRASPRTRPGTRRVRVLATGDGRTVRRTLLVTVARPAQRRFTLAVAPARQEITAGAVGRYIVHVARARGFRAAVRLRLLGVPRGISPRVQGAALRFRTAPSTGSGDYLLVIQGSSRLGGRVLLRYAVVELSVSAPDVVAGSPGAAVFPGGRSPVDLVLTNSHAFGVRVRGLRVSVRRSTGVPGCSGDIDFEATQYAGAYPLRLAPGTTRLSTLVPDASVWPHVVMLDLPRNQDACRRADVKLDYSMLVTR